MNKLDNIKGKIVSPEIIARLRAGWRIKDQKVVFTNGCFDVLHVGHVEYLAKAASLGDILVVGLNSDASVHRLKGPGRPINNEYARSILLASLEVVFYVVLFDDDTPFYLINIIKPDILVKGADYKVENIVGADILASYSGEVVTIPLTPGYSTTALLESIKK